MITKYKAKKQDRSNLLGLATVSKPGLPVPVVYLIFVNQCMYYKKDVRTKQSYLCGSESQWLLWTFMACNYQMKCRQATFLSLSVPL